MAKACDRLCHRIHDGFWIGTVGFDRDHGLAMRFRRAGGFGRLLRRVGVGQRNRRAVRSKSPHDRRTNAREPPTTRATLSISAGSLYICSPLLTNESKIVQADARSTAAK